MISVYNDAKRLMSSAYSWPSRVVASQTAAQYNCNNPFVAYEPSSFDLQYIPPTSHRELCSQISRNSVSILHLLWPCHFVVTLQWTEHSQFLLAKIVYQTNEECKLFVGLSEVDEPSAARHLKALQAGANATVGFDTLLKKMNHLSTDSENKNVGKHHGLWKLIEDERRKASCNHIPLMKSVCAVHSSPLAYKDLCKCILEIPNPVSILSGLSTFFTHLPAERLSFSVWLKAMA